VLNDIFRWERKTGSLNLSGDLSAFQGTQRSVSGSLSPYGRISFVDAIINRFSDATLAPSGSLYRNIISNRGTYAGYLAFVGVASFLATFERSLTGGLTFVGSVAASLSSFRFYTATGVMTFAGSVTRAIVASRTYIGDQTFLGDVSRKIDALRTRTGDLSFSGNALGNARGRDWRLGWLSFAGVPTRFFVGKRTPVSSISFSGNVTRQISNTTRTVYGELSPTGRALEKIRETLYLGPPNP
jgi:hypothetical protein